MGRRRWKTTRVYYKRAHTKTGVGHVRETTQQTAKRTTGEADDDEANEDADEETRVGRKGCINYAGSPLQRTHPTD